MLKQDSEGISPLSNKVPFAVGPRSNPEQNAIPGSSEDGGAIIGSCTGPLPKCSCRYLFLYTASLFVFAVIRRGHNRGHAGVGTSGPNRDLFQERQALSGIAGTTYEPYQRTRHHRTQHLHVGEGGVLRLDPGKPGVGGRPLFYKPTDCWESSKAGDERLGWSTRPSSAPSNEKPNWIARDKQVTSRSLE